MASALKLRCLLSGVPLSLGWVEWESNVAGRLLTKFAELNPSHQWCLAAYTDGFVLGRPFL